jgi:hypothetical protein
METLTPKLEVERQEIGMLIHEAIAKRGGRGLVHLEI